jgi:hypothetical protein
MVLPFTDFAGEQRLFPDTNIVVDRYSSPLPYTIGEKPTIRHRMSYHPRIDSFPLILSAADPDIAPPPLPGDPARDIRFYLSIS